MEAADEALDALDAAAAEAEARAEARTRMGDKIQEEGTVTHKSSE